MRWKLAFDDVMAKRFGDLYIDGKFPVNAYRCKVLHRRYYAKRLEAKQVIVPQSYAILTKRDGESRSGKGKTYFVFAFSATSGLSVIMPSALSV